MDKASALHMLNLGPNATRTEAKKAFRQMAKSWHPDRFAGRPEAAGAETRMKLLNEAFGILITQLPEADPEVELKKDQVGDAAIQKKSSTPKPGFFSALRNRMVSSKGLGRAKTKQRGTGRARRPAPGVHKSAGKRAAAGKKTGGCTGKDSFDSFLKGVGTGGMAPAGRKSPGTGAPAYEAYSRYVRLKQHMTSQQRRSRGSDVGRVEKVNPVGVVHRVDGG